MAAAPEQNEGGRERRGTDKKSCELRLGKPEKILSEYL